MEVSRGSWGKAKARRDIVVGELMACNRNPSGSSSVSAGLRLSRLGLSGLLRAFADGPPSASGDQAIIILLFYGAGGQRLAAGVRALEISRVVDEERKPASVTVARWLSTRHVTHGVGSQGDIKTIPG